MTYIIKIRTPDDDVFVYGPYEQEGVADDLAERLREPDSPFADCDVEAERIITLVAASLDPREGYDYSGMEATS